MPVGLLYVAVTSLLIGAGMIGFWSVAVRSGGVPEIREGRADIWFHVAAEAVTALTLVGGGIGVLVDHRATWSAALSSLGLGLLVYTLIASPGYYVQRREPAMVAMFGAFWVLTLPAVVMRFTA